MNLGKWVHVRIQGWKGLATVIVPYKATVADFKEMLGLDPHSAILVPGQFLPLAGEAVLYDAVNDFDTITIER